jgi:hypothetical protein
MTGQKPEFWGTQAPADHDGSRVGARLVELSLDTDSDVDGQTKAPQACGA